LQPGELVKRQGIAQLQHLVHWPTTTTNDDGQAFELRVTQQFDGRVERIHVQVGHPA
jgi:hypothetical protein